MIARLLDEARAAREGRDRWREIGPTLTALRDAGVPLSAIAKATGINAATISRRARTGPNTHSTTGP